MGNERNVINKEQWNEIYTFLLCLIIYEQCVFSYKNCFRILKMNEYWFSTFPDNINDRKKIDKGRFGLENLVKM